MPVLALIGFLALMWFLWPLFVLSFWIIAFIIVFVVVGATIKKMMSN